MRELFKDAQSAFVAFQEGEERGLEFFFNLYYTQLVYYASSITQNDAAAEELASEAFVRIWQHRESVGDSHQLKNLLYKIVRNASIDHLRNRKTKGTSVAINKAESLPDADFLNAIITTETFNRIHNLLKVLPPKCRQVFEAYYFHDKSLKEIAAELNISLGTAKSQKYRAVEILQKLGKTAFLGLSIMALRLLA